MPYHNGNDWFCSICGYYIGENYVEEDCTSCRLESLERAVAALGAAHPKVQMESEAVARLVKKYREE